MNEREDKSILGTNGLRPSVFNRYIGSHEDKLVFNMCSCSLVELEKDKFNALKEGNLGVFSEEELKALQKMNFVNSIPDEREYVMKEHFESSSSKDRLSLTVFTTTVCNARCPYCFEKDMEKISPSKEDVENIIRFILKHKERKIHLKWFGGEPLMNTALIDRVSSELKANNVDFHSSMITNGYLIASNLGKVRDWNLKTVQITLDGINEKYNAVKRYVYKNDENPFLTVVSGIKGLLALGVRISVRLNFDKHNYKDVIECIDYLHKEIGHPANFKMYCHNIFGPEESYYLDDGTNLYQIVVGEMIRRGYINTVSNLGFRYRPVPCAAYSPDFFVIDPHGRLLKCEHYAPEEIEPSIVGDVNTGVTDQKNYDYWLNRDYPYRKCASCEFLPLCQGGCRFESKRDYENGACLPYRDCIDELIYAYYSYKKSGCKLS